MFYIVIGKIKLLLMGDKFPQTPFSSTKKEENCLRGAGASYSCVRSRVYLYN